MRRPGYNKAVFSIGKIDLKLWISQNSKKLILLTFLIMAVYGVSLPNAFVSDDTKGIVQSFDIIKDSQYFLRVQNIQSVIFFFSSNVFGQNPFVFRLLNNFIFHLGSTLLLFFLLSLTKNKFLALATSCLFAVHPIISEPVVWISSGSYLQSSFVLLLSFTLYVLSKEHPKLFIYSIITYLAALLFTDPRVVFFCGVIVLYDFTFGDLQKDYKKFSWFILLSIIFLVIKTIPSSNFREMHLVSENLGESRVQDSVVEKVPVSLLNYFLLTVWPQKLTIFHYKEHLFGTDASKGFVFSLLFFLTYFGFLIYFFYKNKALFFWMAFILVTLSVTWVPWINVWTVGERYFYFSSIGAFFLIASLFDYLINRFGNAKAFYVVSSCLIIALSVRTIFRIADWKSEEAFYGSFIRDFPGEIRGDLFMRDYYKDQNRFDLALQVCHDVVKNYPDFVWGEFCLCDTYDQMNKFEEAIASCERLVARAPEFWRGYKKLGGFYLIKNDFAKAEKALNIALKYADNDYQLFGMLGQVSHAKGDTKSAIMYFKRSLELNPYDEIAQKYLQVFSPN